MEIKFLGTGGAFDFEKGTSAAMVTVGGKNILIDCGFSTILKLAEKDLAKDIDYILVTHLHSDHVGSLPTLVAYIYYKLGQQVPPIITPTIKFQAELEAFATATFVDKHFKYTPIEQFSDIGYIDTYGQHAEGMQTYAYHFTEGDQLIYYSGDIGNADVAQDFLSTRTESQIQVFHETTPRTDIAVHASYREVAEKLGHYDTYVYHIAKENMPADCTLKYVENYPEFLV